MKITYLGHSGFMIECCGDAIAIDPFISTNPSCKHTMENVKVKDILLTHGHGDHAGDAVNLAKSHNAIITATFELANYCSAHGAQTIGMNMGGRIKYKWGMAVLVPASHSSSTPDGKYAGDPGGYVIEICGNTIYHAGDTGLTYEMKMIKEVFSPDIALLPIGGHFTMGIDDAVIAAHWLGVKHVIPMHYNTFPPIQTDPAVFAKKLHDKLKIDCSILSPGESKEFRSVCKVAQRT